MHRSHKELTLVQGQLRSVRPLVTALPPDINGYSLKKASFPSQNLENDWSNADLAALYTDHSSADLPFWFVPCATVPQPGQAVTVLGHGGVPLSYDIAGKARLRQCSR